MANPPVRDINEPARIEDIVRARSVTPGEKRKVDRLLLPKSRYRGLPGGRAKGLENKGVQFYLKRINQALEKENDRLANKPEFRGRYIEIGIGERILPRLVIKTYIEGLNATKLYGKNAIKHPDFRTRIIFADRLAEFFKWRRQEGTAAAPAGTNYSQFNFFSVPEDKRGKFDQDFKVFLKHFYNKNKDQDS